MPDVPLAEALNIALDHHRAARFAQAEAIYRQILHQQPNHPDDERLAALAASEPEAIADGPLVTHVSGCSRCNPIVEDLGTLRSALAD